MVQLLDGLLARAVACPKSGLPALSSWRFAAACLRGTLGQRCTPPPALCLLGCAAGLPASSSAAPLDAAGAVALTGTGGLTVSRPPQGPQQIAQAAAEGGRGGGQGGGATPEGRALLEALLGEGLGDHVLLLRLYQACPSAPHPKC